MFAKKFDALMNIAEVSNSLLGRDVHLSPSYIGRLRSGDRPLPKNHEYISSICMYLANHMKKDYQLNAFRQLTGTGDNTAWDAKSIALYMERWLLDAGFNAAVDEGADSADLPWLELEGNEDSKAPGDEALCDEVQGDEGTVKESGAFLYGNAGKRGAVEQFFRHILGRKTPCTLLLFSDEDMSWLYEDKQFTLRWAEMFKAVLKQGNRVKIIHTISRDINEMMEAINKWLPIYATGMVEPYFYPRLRDGIFRRTLFIAPGTAAVASSSVQNDTSGMLNHFITDSGAVDALCLEFNRYLSMCLPLMKVYSKKSKASFQEALAFIESGKGSSILFSREQDEADFSSFRSAGLASVLLNEADKDVKLCSSAEFLDNTVLYIKENGGIVMMRITDPDTAFLIDTQNLVSAFWDYFTRIRHAETQSADSSPVV